MMLVMNLMDDASHLWLLICQIVLTSLHPECGVCVRVHVCQSACVSECMCVRVHVCTSACVSECMCVRVHVCESAYARVRVCVRVHVRVRV